MSVTVIGTSHISPDSIRETKEVIAKKKPDCVAVELCPERYFALLHGRRKPSLKFGLAGYVFAVIQEHLSHKTHIMPGAEMMSAVRAGKKVGAQVVLIDIPIRDTMHKIQKIPALRKMKMIFSLLIDSFRGGRVKMDISKVPDEKVIDKAMEYFKKDMPEFYEILVVERNRYMYEWIKRLSEEFKHIVVVVGAGHRKDLEKMIKRGKL